MVLVKSGGGGGAAQTVVVVFSSDLMLKQLSQHEDKSTEDTAGSSPTP